MAHRLFCTFREFLLFKVLTFWKIYLFISSNISIFRSFLFWFLIRQHRWQSNGISSKYCNNSPSCLFIKAKNIESIEYNFLENCNCSLEALSPVPFLLYAFPHSDSSLSSLAYSQAESESFVLYSLLRAQCISISILDISISCITFSNWWSESFVTIHVQFSFRSFIYTESGWKFSNSFSDKIWLLRKFHPDLSWAYLTC